MRSFFLGLLAMLSTPAPLLAQPIDTIYLPKTALASLESGKVVGAFPDIIREAAELAGTKVTLQPVAWRRAQVIAKSQDGAAIAPLTRVPQREDQYVWIEEFYPLQLIYMQKKGSQNRPKSIRDMAGLRVAILSGSVADVITKKMDLQGVELYHGTSDEAILKMLQRGRVDGWLIWELVGLSCLKKLDMTDQVEKTFSYNVGPLYLATNQSTSSDEIERWRQAINELRNSGRIRQIIYEHYGDI